MNTVATLRALAAESEDEAARTLNRIADELAAKTPVHTVLETTGGRKEGAKFSREHGPSSHFEEWHSPARETTIRCSSDEREDFERETGQGFEADVLPAAQRVKFATWSKSNCNLKLWGCFE